MNPTAGYYSIIQYCPDLGRFEAANVGVVLFCPEIGFLDAMTAKNNARIIRFFGSEGHDWKRINILKRGITDRLRKEAPEIKSVTDLRHFIALRANALQFTEPNSIRVVDPNQELRDLFEQIIDESAGGEHRASFRKDVGQYLLSAGLQDRIDQDVVVEVPILQKKVEFPYGYQNGRFNLIRPVQFESKDADQSVVRACKYAVEGREIYEHQDPTRGAFQLVILGRFRASDTETPASIRRIFREYPVKLYEAGELPALVDEIRRTGKILEKRIR